MTRNEQPGFDPALHDADFYVWTQRQATALRAMPRDPSVDIDHVAEEIEDLGKRDLDKVTSYLMLAMQHLMKLHALPGSRDAAHWYQEASNFQDAVRKAFSPGMRQLVDPDEIWRTGGRGLARFFRDVGCRPPSGPCPFSLDDLLTRSFDIERAIERIRSRNDGKRDMSA